MAAAITAHVPPLESSVDPPRPKPGRKSVTWASQDKLCQVRLFAEQDAPALSGKVLENLVQAKKGSLHSISEDDVPPGFEAIAANRFQCAVEEVTTMVPQLKWQCPFKVMYDEAWQVAAGEDTLEVSVQNEREMRVLEAFYPRVSTIPVSPAELQEIYTEIPESLIPEIPLMPLDDDDQEMDGQISDGTQKLNEMNNSSHHELNNSSTAKSVVIKGTEPCEESPSRITITDSNANVAAAAAAAYTVLKAKESGLIDHDLLIKILNNPDMMKTLMSVDPKQTYKRMGSSEVANSDSLAKMIYSSFGSGSQTMSYVNSYEKGYYHDDRVTYPGQQIQGNVGMPVNGNQFQQNVEIHNKNVIQHNGFPLIETSSNWPKQGTFGSEQDRLKVAGYAKVPSINTWMESNNVSHNNNNGTPQETVGVDMQRSKSRKACMFFNTPKGCRNGINCNFTHSTIPSISSRMRTDNFDFHQAKKQKLDMVNHLK